MACMYINCTKYAFSQRLKLEQTTRGTTSVRCIQTWSGPAQTCCLSSAAAASSAAHNLPWSCCSVLSWTPTEDKVICKVFAVQPYQICKLALSLLLAHCSCRSAHPVYAECSAASTDTMHMYYLISIPKQMCVIASALHLSVATTCQFRQAGYVADSDRGNICYTSKCNQCKLQWVASKVCTNASHHASSGTMLQDGHPLTYISHDLSAAEQQCAIPAGAYGSCTGI